MSNLTGTVKFFNFNKGYGFIKPDSGEKDLFVHINNVKSGVLEDGIKVSYKIIADRNGKDAAGEVEVI